MTFHHYAELRSAASGQKIATLWNHSQFVALLNAGFGPSWAAGKGLTDPAADAVAAAIGATSLGSPALDGAWWAGVAGAETAAGMLVTRITGLDSGASSRAVLSSVNSDTAIVDRRGNSPRVITIDADLYAADPAAVRRLRSELFRLLDPFAHSDDQPSDDLELWWPELCEAGATCATKPGNCTGVHWRHVRQVSLIDTPEIGDRLAGRGANTAGAAANLRFRLVAADPRIYHEADAPIVVTPAAGAITAIAADPAHTTVSTQIALPKSALPIRLNPDRTWCEIGWDVATRDAATTYLEVGDLKEVYTPTVSVYDEDRVEPYGVRLFWNEFVWAAGNYSGKRWEKINESRWPADGSFPTDAPIEVQQIRVWEPGGLDAPSDAPVYGVHLFWEPNAFDSTRERFVWEPINYGRWPRQSGPNFPMPDDGPIEVQLITYPNVEFDDGEPEHPVNNPKWVTVRNSSSGEPFEVRLLERSTTASGGQGRKYGLARPVRWALPLWNSVLSENTSDITHTITAGQTISSIAATYGVTEAALVAANPAVNIYSLAAGAEIIIPDQIVEDPNAQVQFPPRGGYFVVKHTRGMYQEGGADVEVDPNWRNGGFVEAANTGREPFDIVLTRNGRWHEANSTWSAGDLGVPPDGGRIRLLPDWNPYSPATDPAAVDAYACPTLDPELPITVDLGAKTWAESGGWAFDGEWPADSAFTITGHEPGTYLVNVDVHDPNCPACGPAGCDLAAIFGDSVYVADVPAALTDIPSGVTIGTPPSSVRRTALDVGPADPADPFDLTITIDPGTGTLRNWRLVLWENHAAAAIGTLDRCSAYRFRFADLPTGAVLRLDTQQRRAILDCGDGLERDAAALVAGEHGGRPSWPTHMAGRWTVAIEADPSNTPADATITIAERVADPAV